MLTNAAVVSLLWAEHKFNCGINEKMSMTMLSWSPEHFNNRWKLWYKKRKKMILDKSRLTIREVAVDDRSAHAKQFLRIY